VAGELSQAQTPLLVLDQVIPFATTVARRLYLFHLPCFPVANDGETTGIRDTAGNTDHRLDFFPLEIDGAGGRNIIKSFHIL
jgi:hypothetical protein